MHRDLYLAAYDVANHRRLAAALHLVRAYATGGQKSVHELFLTPAEKHELLHTMALILDAEEDRFLLLRLDPRARTYALGRAKKPADPEYFYVG
ncbi:MAG: CRISPR-associated endonuclease Cas2 [Rhodocyclaceae bacterium]|nr:CRISPR-associated endonuclease Cas2 [Rhodocyclaceae bacterium]